MSQGRKRGLEYRREAVEYVTTRWLQSASTSVVGVGSAGKTNLIQHLIQPEVRAQFLGERAERIIPIVLDANMIGPLPSPDAPDNEQIRCWAGYELLMHRTFMAFYPFQMLSEAEARQFYEAYQAMQDGMNPLYAYLALRYVELGLEYFFQKGYSIVFLFDEFEEMLKQLPMKFFQTLRGLRDAHKTQLSYTTFTRSPLPVLVERLGLPTLAAEPFIELFTDNVYYLATYNERDAQQMVTEIASKKGLALPSPLSSRLMAFTGRYAGLLRASVSAIDAATIPTLESADERGLTEFFLRKPAIRTECQTIWMGLNGSEQRVLKALARRTSYNVSDESELAIAMLMQRQLVRLDSAGKTLHVQPLLFRAYVESDPAFT